MAVTRNPIASLFGLALSAALIWPAPASAQRTKFDGLRQCEHYAAQQFRKRNPAFRRFIIDRASVGEDRYAGQIGQQFISTVYHGRATFEAAGGPQQVRFICLHAGYRRGAVFVYTMPE
jgi:hypothetical protein